MNRAKVNIEKLSTAAINRDANEDSLTAMQIVALEKAAIAEVEALYREIAQLEIRIEELEKQ